MGWQIRCGYAVPGVVVSTLLLACARPDPLDLSVLLVSVDTLRPDYLSASGYDRPTTPFVDSLLAQGFYFQQAVSPVPRTTPALASLLTGAYPHTTRVRTLTDSLSDDVIPLAEILGGWDYGTMAVVSNHVLPRSRRLDRGFEVYDMAPDARDARATTNAALRQLRRFDPAYPLFAWVHYIDPHVPYHPDPAIAAEFDPDYRGPYRFQFGEMSPPRHAYPRELSKRQVTHENDLPDSVNEHVRRLYAADVASMDPEIERLVGGFRDHTGGDLIVIFTADHGESLGEHHFYFDHGDYVYNAESRVPLAVVLPESHPQSGSGRCGGWVSLVDVVPTLVELLGRELPPEAREQLEGRSLVACMRGEALDSEPVFIESGHSYFPEAVRRRVRNDTAGRFRAVLLGDWKLIFTPFQVDSLAWDLFQVSEDPEEKINLYAADRPEVAVLKAHLAAWMARQDPEELSAGREISEEDRERLRNLGYLD